MITAASLSVRAEAEDSVSEVGLDLDLDKMRWIGQPRDLDHGRHWPYLAEEFVVCPPHLCLKGDVGDVHPGSYDLLRCHACSLQGVECDREGGHRLPVRVTWMEHAVQAGCCGSGRDRPI